MATVKKSRGKKQTKASSNARFFTVECPNCRAAKDKPCKWEDGSICRDRRERYFSLPKSDVAEEKTVAEEVTDFESQEDAEGTD